MNIDFGRGIQRIYFILSFGWIVFFGYFLIDGLKISDNPVRYVVSWHTYCDDINNPNAPDSKKKKELKEAMEKYKETNPNSSYFNITNTNKKPSDKEVYKNVQKKSGFIKFIDSPGTSGCLALVDRNILERTNLREMTPLLSLTILPVPFYFLMLFIIRGFKKKEAPKRKGK